VERIYKDKITRFWTLLVSEKGESKYKKDIPCLVISRGENGNKIGEYCYAQNQISIWIGPHLDFKELASTIAHEYEHYLQFPSWYFRYKKMYEYKDNPYEIEATQAEMLAPLLIEGTTDRGWESFLRKKKSGKRIYDYCIKKITFKNEFKN